jgi:hypothetical protein
VRACGTAHFCFASLAAHLSAGHCEHVCNHDVMSACTTYRLLMFVTIRTGPSSLSFRIAQIRPQSRQR